MKKSLLLLLLVVAVAVAGYILGRGAIPITSFAMVINVLTGSGIETPEAPVIKQRLNLPEGFSMSLYASGITKARFLLATENGDLLVSRPRRGDILLLRPDPDAPDRAGEPRTLLSDLKNPSGMDIENGWLYIGESNAVGRVRFDAQKGEITGEYQHIISGLTDDGNHRYKVVGVGPDKKLYLSQGSTCNVCVEDDPRRATISRFNLDGSGEELFATGLRNSMGMDWAPWSDALYATDNGRDMLGDDYPPCELNKIEAGKFYGWPYFNGDNEPDPDFNKAPAELAANPVAPAHKFAAHNAPLGLKFIDTESWPESFDKVALAALHGSWNRSTPDGYKVVSLHWQDGEIIRRDFLTGFELGGNIIGRPVDVAQGPDGVIYISDDYAGAIYRVSYTGTTADEIELPTASAQPFKLQTPEWLTPENKAELSELGQLLLIEHACASCHLPETPIARMQLRTLNERLQYAEVINQLSDPTAPMPLYSLTAREQRALAVYLLNQR